MRVQGKVESTAVFVIAVGFSLGLFLALFLVIWDSQKEAIQINEVHSERLDIHENMGIDAGAGILTEGEKKRAWTVAMNGLIKVEHKAVDGSNAGYKFEACFIVGDDCVLSAKAFRDEFQKTTYYFAPSSFTDARNHISFYIKQQDGELPHVVMRFVYFGESWLGLNKAAVLVDDEVILNRLLLRKPGNQNALRGDLVYEFGDLQMDNDINVIELIAGSQVLAIRMMGKLTFVHLDEDKLNNAKNQAKEILLMQKLMNEALIGVE